jgi:hypothetical protein
MRTILIGLSLAIGVTFAAGGPAAAAPANGTATAAATGDLSVITQAQYCRCGRVCYARDYYGRCISWRCRSCGGYGGYGGYGGGGGGYYRY